MRTCVICQFCLCLFPGIQVVEKGSGQATHIRQAGYLGMVKLFFLFMCWVLRVCTAIQYIKRFPGSYNLIRIGWLYNQSKATKKLNINLNNWLEYTFTYSTSYIIYKLIHEYISSLLTLVKQNAKLQIQTFISCYQIRFTCVSYIVWSFGLNHTILPPRAQYSPGPLYSYSTIHTYTHTSQ